MPQFNLSLPISIIAIIARSHLIWPGSLLLLLFLAVLAWLWRLLVRKPYPYDTKPSAAQLEAIERQLEDTMQQLRGFTELSTPEKVALLEQSARMFMQLDEIAYAIFACREAIAARQHLDLPPNPELIALYAVGLSTLRQFEEADEQFKTALELFRQRRTPIDPMFFRDYAVNQGELGRWQEELELYDQADAAAAAQRLPLHYGIALNRGAVYRQQGRQEMVLVQYAEAERRLQLAHLPPDPDISFNRGVWLHYAGQPEAALREFAKAERQAPPNYFHGPQLALSKADAYEQIEHYDQALLEYTKADELCQALDEPLLVEAAKSRSVLHSQLGQDQEALLWIQSAVQRSLALGQEPDAGILNTYGIVLRHLSRFDEALAKFDAVEQYHRECNTDPGPALAFNRALVYADLGQLELARKLALEAQAKADSENAPLPYATEFIELVEGLLPKQAQGHLVE